MQLGPHHYFEFLGLITGILLYPRLRNSFMAFFIPFLALILAAELFANYSHYTLKQPTVWIFNILTAFITLFYGFIFYKFSDSSKQKNAIKALLVLYMACWFIFYFIINSINQFNNYLFAFASLVQILFACLLFYRYLLNDDPAFHRKNKSGLWIAAGVLIFNCGIAIVFTMYDYIKDHQLKLAGMPLYNFFPRYLSILLYSCIAVSFLSWRKPTPT